jgi:hypothetical protein
MFKKILQFSGTILILLFLASCSSTSPQQESLLDQNWGRSFESAKYNQILNPDAEKNLEPVTGLDGTVSESVVTNYKKSFKKGASSSGTVINIGK